MIPNEEQLQAIARMKAGSLAEVPYAVVLHALAVHQRSAVLEIERPPLKKSIVIEAGVPVDCRSNMLHETLSRFMVARGDITEEVCQEYLNKSVARGLQFGEALILDGRISASELYKILQLNLAKKLLDGFSWRTGEFRLSPELPQVESPLKVKAPQLIVTGIAKFALDEEVNGAIGPLVGKRLFLHPAPPFPLQDIRLTPNQRRLTALLQQGKRIDELAAETTIPFSEIMRLLYSLAVIGVVVPEERMPVREAAAESGPEVELEPEVPAVVDEPALTVSPEAARKAHDAVIEAYLRYRRQDAFDLLGVAEDAGLDEIDRKFLDFCRRFAPWQFTAPELANLAEKSEALFLAGGRAFGELSNADLRQELIARRHTLREERARRPARDRFVIKSELLDPELQFKKGKALMAAGLYREALQQLNFAYDCDPQNSDYRADLAYCRFLESPATEADRSLGELQETLRVDPKCGLAVYYAGMILSETDRYDEAEEHLQRAIKMLMPDRRPIEGLKELQAKQKKKKRRLL